jgi:di/tricarboxylate transporter
MPTPAVAVLLAPIAFNTAGDLGISPHALLMTVAMSASASFLSPVAHPANVLTMGPGGYRFADYIKVGIPLTLVVLVVVLLVLPLFWPL